VKTYWNVFKAQIKKTFILRWRYLFNTVSTLATFYVVFLLMFTGARSLEAGPVSADNLEGLLVGYLVWMFATMGYSRLAHNLTREAQIGTLEQLHLSPAGFGWVNAAELFAWFAWDSVAIFLVLLAISSSTGQHLHLDLVSLIPLLVVTTSGAYGVGLIMGGLALVYKQVQGALQILQFAFIACLVAPARRFPLAAWLPLNAGNRLIQQVMIDGRRLWELPGDLLLVALGAGFLYLVAGGVVFSLCDRRARRDGLLAQY